MNGIGTHYTGLRRDNRICWENTLGRLDAIADQINRALHRSTRTEEPRSGTWVPGKITKGGVPNG
jgi:hypothetical protein